MLVYNTAAVSMLIASSSVPIAPSGVLLVVTLGLAGVALLLIHLFGKKGSVTNVAPLVEPPYKVPSPEERAEMGQVVDTDYSEDEATGEEAGVLESDDDSADVEDTEVQVVSETVVTDSTLDTSEDELDTDLD